MSQGQQAQREATQNFLKPEATGSEEKKEGGDEEEEESSYYDTEEEGESEQEEQATDASTAAKTSTATLGADQSHKDEASEVEQARLA